MFIFKTQQEIISVISSGKKQSHTAAYPCHKPRQKQNDLLLFGGK